MTVDLYRVRWRLDLRQTYRADSTIDIRRIEVDSITAEQVIVFVELVSPDQGSLTKG